ncbi:histone H1-like [Zingiber officinale]|uniref:histone H1-like n=1 Tax=Zingiber officinale TaxID=94328 RepID=UPI001C4C5B81|nr:histone H1-like [Zingiber officinale]
MASKDSKARKPASHPPYAEMIKEAIATLKERSGSSTYAIGKYIEDKHKGHLPSNFRKFITSQLKKLAAEGKLTKVKRSYKLSTPEKPKAKPAVIATKSKPKTSAIAPKPKAKTKPAGVGVKTKSKAAAKQKPKTTPKGTGKAAKKDAPGKKVEEKRKPKTVAASAKVARTTRKDILRKIVAAPQNPMTAKKSKAVKAAPNKAK